ncbi:hypothetical protein HDU67_002981 [Dinochytrium kinnereticum]|nr:hypothetical protein HDU67_002981 [Dinochytrium kinnereticum]
MLVNSAPTLALLSVLVAFLAVAPHIAMADSKCGNGTMPLLDVCCAPKSNTYCPYESKCSDDGTCMPRCDFAKTECGGGCLSYGQVCCGKGDSAFSCPSSSYECVEKNSSCVSRSSVTAGGKIVKLVPVKQTPVAFDLTSITKDPTGINPIIIASLFGGISMITSGVFAYLLRKERSGLAFNPPERLH